MKKKLVCAILLSAISSATFAYEQYQPYQPYQVNQQNQQQYQPYQTINPYANSQTVLKGNVFMVPAGAEIPAVSVSEINSQYLILGQVITLSLGQDYYYNNQLVAPAGSVVNGTVIQLKKGTFAGRNGMLQIKFTSIVTPFGQMIPISGQIKTEDGSGILRGATAMSTAAEYAKDVGVGAASGAIAGLVMSAVSGGSIGKGTALGTALGGGLGLGKSVADKGADVIIPANTGITLQLDQPMTVNSASSYHY